MKDKDPFSQLERYMKQQNQHKKQPNKPQQVSQQPSFHFNPHPPPKESKAMVQKIPIPQMNVNFIENRSIKQKAYEPPIQSPVEKNEPNRPFIRPSPMRLQENNTKSRVFVPNEDVQSQRQPEKFHRPVQSNRSVSQKSYDFVANNKDYELERMSKINNRKRKLIEDYQVHNDFWNKDTVIVYNEIVNKVSNLEEAEKEIVKREIYEDPKLKKMKELMNYHQEKLKEKDSNAVLMGICEGDTKKENERRSLIRRTEDRKEDVSPQKLRSDGHRMRNLLFGINEGNKEETETVGKPGNLNASSSNTLLGGPEPVKPNKAQNYKPSVNNIFPSNDQGSENKTQNQCRKTTPFKYKYDFSSQISILQRHHDQDCSKSPDAHMQKSFSGYNRENDQVSSPKMFLVKENDLSKSFANPERSPGITLPNDKRALVLTPSRRSLMSEYRAKLNLPNS